MGASDNHGMPHILPEAKQAKRRHHERGRALVFAPPLALTLFGRRRVAFVANQSPRSQSELRVATSLTGGE
jgi:hypothetical protein